MNDTSTMRAKEAIRYAHEFVKGEEYAPLSFVVTPEMSHQFLFALDEFDEEFLHSGGWGAPIVHPVILLHMSARTRSPSFRLPPNIGSVFAKDSVTFNMPGRVGDHFSVTWKILDVYEKRDRIYQSLQTQVWNSSGAEVLSRNVHSVFFTERQVIKPQGDQK